MTILFTGGPDPGDHFLVTGAIFDQGEKSQWTWLGKRLVFFSDNMDMTYHNCSRYSVAVFWSF